MQKIKAGFTLIELLVVVLIIGILSAVALPQYTNAVRKARITEARINLKTLVDASDMCVLANGDTTGCWFDDLDVQVPAETKFWKYYFEMYCQSENTTPGVWAYAVPKFESGYNINYLSANYCKGDPSSGVYAGKFLCGGDENICKTLGSAVVNGSEGEYIELR